MTRMVAECFNDPMGKGDKHMAEITPDEQGLFITPEMDDTTEIYGLPDVPKYIMPDHLYDVLKWVGLIFCPALAALVGAVGPAWGMPNVDAVVLTINALGTFIGVCIGASHLSSMGR